MKKITHNKILFPAVFFTALLLPLAFSSAQAGSPVISDISSNNITAFTADIRWTTSIPADGQVEICPTPSHCGFNTPVVSELHIQHLINLSGLLPNKTYYFWVTSGDSVSSVNSFVTTNEPPISMNRSGQLLIRTSPARYEGDYEEGDVVDAFNVRRILNVHAQNITNPKNFGFNSHGLRNPGTLLEEYLKNSKELKFVRMGEDKLKKINLVTGEESVISNMPNEKGEQMDVAQYIERRLKHTRHQIFGNPGSEYWYGGNDVIDDVKLDKVWQAIEKSTVHRKDNYHSFPLTPAELREYTIIPVNDFSDEKSAELSSNELNTNGEVGTRRKYRVDIGSLNNQSAENRKNLDVIVKEKPAKPQLGLVSRLFSNILVRLTNLFESLYTENAYAAGTIITSIGTRAAENINITGVSGAGPYTVTIAGATSNTVVGDTLTDEAATPNSYLITAINGTEITVRDALGAGTSPSSAGSVQATTVRTYSTMTNWEADLDDTGLYASGDTAQGEVYNDSIFTETLIVINGGVTVGLSKVKLTVPVGERHDGTASTGARIVRTAGGSTIFNLIPLSGAQALIIEWLEVNINGNNYTSNVINTSGATAGRVPVVQNMLMHDMVTTSALNTMMGDNGRDGLYQNNIIYDVSASGGNSRSAIAIGYDGDTSAGGVYNNTIYRMVASGAGTGQSAIGVDITSDNANVKVKNNIAVSMTPGSISTAWSFDFPATVANITSSINNLSDDDSADDGGGTGHLINQTLADIFVSTADGAEDLHLKAGSPAINAGTDLGTTPVGVNIDIDGRDRDAEADTWDIGADELVSDGPSYTLTQSNYRWYRNADSIDPTVPLGDENNIANAHTIDPLRLRVNITVLGATLDAGAVELKLKYATSTSGPWTDVGATTSSDPWRFYENPSIATGTTLTTSKLTGTDVYGVYMASNSMPANPNSATVGQEIEYDFSLNPQSAPSDRVYYFRLYKSDNSVLDGYTRYPTLALYSLFVNFGAGPSDGGFSGSSTSATGGDPDDGGSGASGGGESGSTGSTTGGSEGGSTIGGGESASPVMFDWFWFW